MIIPVKRGEENTDYVNASFIDVSAVCIFKSPNVPWRFIWVFQSPCPASSGRVIFESVINSEVIPTLDLSGPREQKAKGSRGTHQGNQSLEEVCNTNHSQRLETLIFPIPALFIPTSLLPSLTPVERPADQTKFGPWLKWRSAWDEFASKQPPSLPSSLFSTSSSLIKPAHSYH